jgi:hypothetical protein
MGARLAALAAGLVLATLGMPAAHGTTPAPYFCSYGSIPGGTYSSVTVTHWCRVDDGDVMVTGSFTVAAGAILDATYAGSNLIVDGTFYAFTNSIVVLGCGPQDAPCSNSDTIQPQQPGGTDHEIFGPVYSSGALAFIAHDNRFFNNVTQSGGGGGVNCAIFPPVLQGSPAYSAWEDNEISRNLTVQSVHSCWMGVIRNEVGRNLTYNQNLMFDPDGNEVNTNFIDANLSCLSNVPPAGIRFDGGDPNVVTGANFGTCPAVSPERA